MGKIFAKYRGKKAYFLKARPIYWMVYVIAMPAFFNLSAPNIQIPEIPTKIPSLPSERYKFLGVSDHISFFF